MPHGLPSRRLVRAVSTGVEVAQHLKLAWRRRRRLRHRGGKGSLPAAVLLDLLAGDARMDGDHGHFLALWIGLEQRQISDQLGRALGLHAEADSAVAAPDIAARG